MIIESQSLMIQLNPSKLPADFSGPEKRSGFEGIPV